MTRMEYVQQSITVNLFANGEKVKDQKVTPDGNGNWNYKFAETSRVQREWKNYLHRNRGCC